MRKIPCATLLCAMSVAAVSQAGDFQESYKSINTKSLTENVKTLASDEFQGRLPGTDGEKKTIDFLIEGFKKYGVKPGNGDSYLQEVPLVSLTADPNIVMTVGGEKFNYKEHMMAGTSRVVENSSIKDSELVFVGYGVNAPEYGWNDYEGIDVKGKTVVILVNDPGFENPDSGKFNGKTMTYYGRWTYKYEEASRQGAAGAFIVHEDKPASYPWSVVANSWSGPQFGLQTPNNNMDRVAIEGWFKRDVAVELFKKAGLDFDKLKSQAMKKPTHKAMGLKASVAVKNSITRSNSFNVIGTIPGSTRPDEHIIYTAHWDHLGVDETSDKKDKIFNGAHDNATGTAALIEIAKAFNMLDQRPERSITLLAVTAEEQGLLGSKHYAANPVIPLNQSVAAINMDSLNILGRTKDVAVVGFGKSELDNYLNVAAKKQNRFLVEEARPEAGIYYRSDHFNFAKKGIPAMYASSGTDPLNEAAAKYRKQMSVITRGCYHQTCDNFRNSWDLSGAVEDVQLFFDVGFALSNSKDWPQWSKTSEFQRKNK